MLHTVLVFYLYPRAGYVHLYSCFCVQGLVSPVAQWSKRAIIAIVCNTIHGIVKEAWEENRKYCQGVTVLHVGKK